MRIPSPYFENIPIIGDLIMDYIIFEYDYPLLFICKTKDEEYYLGDCCDTYKEQRWLLAPISIEDIQKLLRNKITIREAFENAAGLCCVATWSTGDLHEKYKLIGANEFELEDLPEEGAYIDAEDNEHEDYIHRIENKIRFNEEKKLKQKVKIQGEDTEGNAEYNDLIYQYQTEEILQLYAGLGQVKSSINGSITIEKSQKIYYGTINYQQTISSAYSIYAA